MKTIKTIASISLIAVLFLCANPGNAYAQKQLSIDFPEIDGWEQGEITTYPKAELGYSVQYKSRTGGNVTIYVYNGGRKLIADGIEDKNVKNEIKQAGEDIKSYGEQGYYDNVKLVKSESLVLGGDDGTTKSLYSLFSFKIRGTEVDSEIYLFGYKNNFIKIRATRRKGEVGETNQAMVNLLTEIGRVFAH
ncbi:MAG: hypothetical protein HKN25_10350 [Pyrinomonadaceae bacterium]|nr:hypothetical protein [Pyrinomonadaceae bacterium]